MTELAIEAAGWAAALLILASYILISTGRLTGQSVIYQWMNVVGSAGFVVNAGWHGAFPSTALNAVWCAIGLGMLWTGTAQAAQAPDKDMLTVTVTPNASYSMTLSTALAAGSFALGNVNLAASTFTVKPATVTITSSFATTGLTLQGVLSGGWTLETANTAVLAQDKLAAWAVFTDTGVSVAATVAGLAGAFSGTAANGADSDVLSGTAYGVGNAATVGVRQYVLGTGAASNYKSMFNLPPTSTDPGGSAAHLWLKLTLPPTTSFPGQQSLTVVVTAAAPIP